MKRELKNSTFEWYEKQEQLVITAKMLLTDGKEYKYRIILNRSDIFPLMRFCLRIIQRYFVTGLKKKKKKHE